MPKLNAPSANLLLEKAGSYLQLIAQLEKDLIKPYQKMEKAAHTAELTKCLSPGSTDADKHLQRIKLTFLSLGLKKSRQQHLARPKTIKLTRSSILQDLAIIAEALNYQNQKMASYELLHPMIKALAMDTEAELIEQTLTDNRNTNTWLRQIVQNILAPQLNAQIQ